MIQPVNFRLGDSLPREINEKWQAELGLLSGSAGFQPAGSVSNAAKLAGRDAGAPGEASRRKAREIELRRRIDDYLDVGHGACW